MEQHETDYVPIPNRLEDIQRFKDRANVYTSMLLPCDFCSQKKPAVYGMNHDPYGDVLVVCGDCLETNKVALRGDSDSDSDLDLDLDGVGSM